MISVELQKKAIAQRLAGYSLATIAANTGISTRCLKNIFSRHTTEKSGVTADLVKQAKADLLNDEKFKKVVKQSVNSLIRTEIDLSNKLLDSATATLDDLEHVVPLQRSKALASLSTAINNAAIMQRRAIGLKETVDLSDAELPRLFITKLTESEVEQIQRRVNVTDLDLGGNDDGEVICE